MLLEPCLAGVNSPLKEKNLIILYNNEKLKNKYSIWFWRPYSEASLKLTFKLRKHKIKLIDNEMGAF